MNYKIDKLIIENNFQSMVAARKAAFMNGGKMPAADFHKSISGNVAAASEAAHLSSHNKAMQGQGGNVMDPLEKRKAELLAMSNSK